MELYSGKHSSQVKLHTQLLRIIQRVILARTGDKSDSSDYEGNAAIEEVKAGKNTLDITAPGKKPVKLHIKVKSGKDNHFNIQMENL